MTAGAAEVLGALSLDCAGDWPVRAAARRAVVLDLAGLLSGETPERVFDEGLAEVRRDVSAGSFPERMTPTAAVEYLAVMDDVVTALTRTARPDRLRATTR